MESSTRVQIADSQATSTVYILCCYDNLFDIFLMCDVCPIGGSLSNMYAVNLARYHHCPDIKELGLSAVPRLVLFTSQEVGVTGTYQA